MRNFILGTDRWTDCDDADAAGYDTVFEIARVGAESVQNVLKSARSAFITVFKKRKNEYYAKIINSFI